MTIFFPVLGKVLLVDTRHNDDDTPLVKIVPMVTSIEERVKSLQRIRPKYGRPDSVTAIPWLRYVRSLETSGVLDHLIYRLVALGGLEIGEACEKAYRELLEVERKETAAAVCGEGYQTIWQRCR